MFLSKNVVIFLPVVLSVSLGMCAEKKNESGKERVRKCRQFFAGNFSRKNYDQIVEKMQDGELDLSGESAETLARITPQIVASSPLFQGLTVVYLKTCRLTKVPDFVYHLSKLKKLYLNENEFSVQEKDNVNTQFAGKKVKVVF